MVLSEPSTTSKSEPPRARRAVSLSVVTLAWAGVTGVLVIAVVVLSLLVWDGRRDAADRDAAAADTRRAEEVATDYAVGAATVRFDDFNAWVGRLKTNTAPELANKFDATAPKLQEILTPLQWSSTATPIAAKVMSESGGIYQVDVFVDVDSSNIQNPEGARTTVTYTVTVDRDSDWHITDVGGMDATLPVK